METTGKISSPWGNYASSAPQAARTSCWDCLLRCWPGATISPERNNSRQTENATEVAQTRRHHQRPLRHADGGDRWRDDVLEGASHVRVESQRWSDKEGETETSVLSVSQAGCSLPKAPSSPSMKNGLDNADGWKKKLREKTSSLFSFFQRGSCFAILKRVHTKQQRRKCVCECVWVGVKVGGRDSLRE